MLKQGLAKTIVKMLSDDNMEERQHAFDFVTCLYPHCELIALWNNGVLTFCEADARAEMLKQGLAKTIIKILSDDNTEEWQHASKLITCLAPYCELVAL
jgi:hypothetical protein